MRTRPAFQNLTNARDRGGGRAHKFSIASMLVVASVLAAAGNASAVIVTSATAEELALAMAASPTSVGSAHFAELPPDGEPTAVSTTPLAGFPTHGLNYTILTTGNASLAGPASQDDLASVDNNGGNVRGNTDFDVVVLAVNLTVPAGSTCLSFDFKFLSEEFPEFIGSNFNDAFIAELDVTNWTTNGSEITAHNNFAFDAGGSPITINSAGLGMSAANAAGTIYDGATDLLRARTFTTAGAHTLYLSIFDQGDNILDSAVFLDNLQFLPLPESQCQAGVIVLTAADLAIEKSDDPDPVVVGENLTYTLSVRNLGPDNATNVTVTDTLPQNATFVSASASQGSCTELTGVVSCNLGSLPNGSNATITIVVKPDAPGDITNTALVASSTDDPNLQNNAANATTRVVERGDLPAAPTGLTCVALPDGTIALDWNNVPNATSYNIYRAVGGGAFSLLDSANQSEYLDASVEVGQTYSYRVSAVSSTGESALSESCTSTAIPFFNGFLLAGLAAGGSIVAYATLRRARRS